MRAALEYLAAYLGILVLAYAAIRLVMLRNGRAAR